MSAALVVALCAAVLGWFLLVEALHSGLSAASLVRPGRRRVPPWRVLGPLVLVDEVWLVVLLVLPATGLGESVEGMWRRAGPALLAAVLLSTLQFAMLLLAPALRRPHTVARALTVTGTLVPPGWVLALGYASGADPLLTLAYAAAALAAVLSLGPGVLDGWVEPTGPPTGPAWPLPGMLAGAALLLTSGSALAGSQSPLLVAAAPATAAAVVTGTTGRPARVRAGVAAAAVLTLTGAALSTADVLTSQADAATLQVIAVAAVLALPVLIALQACVWRLTLASWTAQRPLRPVDARQDPVTVDAREPGDGRRW